MSAQPHNPLGDFNNLYAELRQAESARLQTWMATLRRPEWADPTISGRHGHAWQIENTLFAEQFRRFMAGPAWFVLLPAAHPLWPHYLLSCAHLRTVDGFPRPQLSFPEATHELVLQALNPESAPNPTDTNGWHTMTPVNVAEQFHVDDDEQAASLVRLVAQALVHGVLPSECDDHIGSRERWRESIAATADHERAGGHIHPVAEQP